MNSPSYMRLMKRLMRHLTWAEGVKMFPYTDTMGFLTIGVGRNLSRNGLRPDEVSLLLQNDASEALKQASELDFWDSLSETRRLIVADMIFNLGLAGFSTFKKFQAALRSEDYAVAADEMVDSDWYIQTGRRAKKLVEAMRTNEWHDG